MTGTAIGPVQVIDTETVHQAAGVRGCAQIQHLGHGERLRFVHWGETGGRTVTTATATVGARKLAGADLAGDVPVGLTFEYDLFPGRTTEDLLVFEAFDPGETVLLELPAEAWGGRGVLRFRIPGSMIATPPGKKPR